jgi:hypothetical protein
MFFAARRAPACSFACLTALFLAVAALEGCGSQAGREEHAVDDYFKASGAKREPVAKVSGHLSVDGQPPASDGRLYVILNDPQHLVVADKEQPKHFARCDEEGNFTFTTYVTGDGVPYGKYVVTFLGLHRPRGGHVGRRAGFKQDFVGPDDLKNLYSDPEKNQTDQTFQINVEPPGRSDYDFNLSVATKDPVPTPSKYAPTRIRE